jgi:hypothetical protein
MHWRGEYRGYDGAYEAGYCARHEAPLPSTRRMWGHRVCADFAPNEFFEKDSQISAKERFSWFGKTLKPTILYVFPYTHPPDIRELEKLKAAAE